MREGARGLFVKVSFFFFNAVVEVEVTMPLFIMCRRLSSCRAPPLSLLVSALLLAGLFFSHASGAPDLLLKVSWREEKQFWHAAFFNQF